jgi:acetylornithine/succinyldiaminopimelate/putrescine aminotransferase
MNPMKDALRTLHTLREQAGPRRTTGLDDATIQAFLSRDGRLAAAIDEAQHNVQALRAEFPGLIEKDEGTLIDTLQTGFVNFYPADQTNPYVPAAARGPWIVSTHGAVIHDSGGYGMIGFGHAPESVLKAMGQRQVMANIMTANFSQLRVTKLLRREIGHARGGVTPFARFICVNSGSEAMTVALRISDINARKQTDPGARHAGKKVMFLTMKGGFHGRTERPAQASSSSRKHYDNLQTFRDLGNNHTIEPNDVGQLREAFAWAAKNNVWFEAMLMEPVMGEGNPGMAIRPDFYALARELTAKEGTLLIMDSIQAGLRATGCLSVCDYPGFEALPPPDMESYSKALNAGQFPLSVLALTEKAAGLYVRGVYGNTKTTNPRALDVASAVLELVTPELRRNVRERGKEFLEKFEGLGREFPDVVTKVQGTGLLFSIEVDPTVFKVTGTGELEEYMRRNGIGVIHGGANSLRFTPHFEVTTPEVDLIVAKLREAFKNGPRKKR